MNGVKVKIKEPNKIYLELLKSNGETRLITIEIEDLIINDGLKAQINGRITGRFENEMTNKWVDCPKCDGHGKVLEHEFF